MTRNLGTFDTCHLAASDSLDRRVYRHKRYLDTEEYILNHLKKSMWYPNETIRETSINNELPLSLRIPGNSMSSYSSIYGIALLVDMTLHLV